MASPQQLIKALAAAQQVTSGEHDRAKSVLAIDIIGCQFVDEDTIRGLGRLCPQLSYVTIFDCLNFDFAWALECQSTSPFSDLPYEVELNFLTPSMPSQLDPNMSTAGHKGKASWRAAVPAQALLGDIDSNHMVRLHALYMLNFAGHENSLVHQELLYHMCNESKNQSPTFCTLKELKAAFLDRTGLDILMLRLAKKVHDHDPTAMLIPWECISPSCKDQDVEDYLKHPGLSMSKATWKIIQNGKDAVGGEDCYRQLAITSCGEHKGNVLQFRA
ncbi:hypothetical protein LTR17_006419 [Elasticomyces elasticus]|nr:hypothetical protein LTR17_006419 [Elasticomyces elasticus]